MKNHELKELLESPRILKVHSAIDRRALVGCRNFEDHILNSIARELSHKIIEHASITTYELEHYDQKVFDVELLTIPRGVWLKIAALLKRHVPVEEY